MLLMIDNYDSFTYNIVHYLVQLGEEVKVVRNDEITVSDVATMQPDRIVISPGPCTPDEAGISVDVIREYAGKIPLLGICLGHQSIAAAFGGRVVRSRELMHGKSSPIHHDGKALFAGLPNPFDAIRYHSLVAERESLPECLMINAWVDNGDIMGISHKELPVWGVQFHPESILSQCGMELLQNFLTVSRLQKVRQ